MRQQVYFLQGYAEYKTGIDSTCLVYLKCEIAYVGRSILNILLADENFFQWTIVKNSCAHDKVFLPVGDTNLSLLEKESITLFADINKQETPLFPRCYS